MALQTIARSDLIEGLLDDRTQDAIERGQPPNLLTAAEEPQLSIRSAA